MHGESSQAVAEAAFVLIYSKLTITKSTGNLACSCKAAAAAWRAHVARVTRDFSAGREPLPVPIDPPPPHTTAPLPLNTTYTRDSVHGAASVGDIPDGQGGCSAACACCRGHVDGGVNHHSVNGAGGEDRTSKTEVDAASPPAAKRRRWCRRDGDRDVGGSSDAAGSSNSNGSSSSSEEADGEERSCACGLLMPAGVPAYQPNGRGLRAELIQQAAAASFVLECGPACACQAEVRSSARDTARGDADAGGSGCGDAATPGRGGRCAARLTQHGLAARVRLSWVPGKGWAAFAAEHLPAGAFVCRYEGELLRSGEAERRLRHVYDRGSGNNSSSSSSSGTCAAAGNREEEGEEQQEQDQMLEARSGGQGGNGSGSGSGTVRRRQVRRRQGRLAAGEGGGGAGGSGGGAGDSDDDASKERIGEGHALLVVREVLPSGLALRLNIDATALGNVARFFNHSCDGGCLLPVVVRRRGSLVPGVGLFARRDIAVGEELTFPYGAPNAGLDEEGAALEEGQEATGLGKRQKGRRRSVAARRRCRCGTSACLGFMPADPA